MSHNATISTLGFCNKKLIRKRPLDPVPIIARWHFSLDVSTTSEKTESHGLMDNRVPAPITPKFLKNSRLLINASFIAHYVKKYYDMINMQKTPIMHNSIFLDDIFLYL